MVQTRHNINVHVFKYVETYMNVYGYFNTISGGLISVFSNYQGLIKDTKCINY